MEEGVWKGRIRMHAHQKAMGPCDRVKRKVRAKKREGILIVKGGKGRSTGIHRGSVEKRIHPTFQVTSNITGTLCGKKEWHAKNGTGLLIHKSVDNKEWVSFTPHCRHTG